APDDGGSAITEYRIFQLKRNDFVRIATVTGSTLAYRDTTARRGKTYTYVVTAVNAVGVGPYSNQATAKAR
ncbi:MAG TPA: fibronectin type III domain-containing protein, partial [Vicinamibacterales bacterium]|nr:fibronectin type III domain-containing protein [Vicinamibacterales bacterium]